MNPVISRRSLWRFYGQLILISLICFGIPTMLTLKFIRNGWEEQSKLFPLLLCMAAFVVTGICTWVSFFKHAPIIRLDQSGISFNGVLYSWDEVIAVQLTGKQPYRFIVDTPMEGAQIVLREQAIKYVYDSFYVNTWRIKCYIRDQLQDTGKITPQLHRSAPTYDLAGEANSFKGNFWLSLRGISVWGFVVLMAYLELLRKPAPKTPIGPALGVCAVWTCIFSYFLFYFQISEARLSVRNHIFWWIHRTYELANIRELVFETSGKLPNCLRIITTDFQSHFYPAGTLRDADWRTLKSAMENRGMTVRNECIPA